MHVFNHCDVDTNIRFSCDFVFFTYCVLYLYWPATLGCVPEYVFLCWVFFGKSQSGFGEWEDAGARATDGNIATWWTSWNRGGYPAGNQGRFSWQLVIPSYFLSFDSLMDWHEQVRFRDFAKSRILRVFMLILPRSKCNGRPTSVPRRPTTLGEMMKVLITFHLVYADDQIGRQENKNIACTRTVVSILGAERRMWPLTCWMLEFKKWFFFGRIHKRSV